MLDKDGRIAKGPASLEGKGIDNLKGPAKSPAAPPTIDRDKLHSRTKELRDGGMSQERAAVQARKEQQAKPAEAAPAAAPAESTAIQELKSKMATPNITPQQTGAPRSGWQFPKTPILKFRQRWGMRNIVIIQIAGHLERRRAMRYSERAKRKDRYVWSDKPLPPELIAKNELTAMDGIAGGALLKEQYEKQHGAPKNGIYEFLKPDGRGMVIHPSAKENGKVQASTFDKNGFIGDSLHDNIDEAISEAAPKWIY